jgi:tetratricopeptide (TPR) repeat protein
MLAHGFTAVSLHLPANALLLAFIFGILASPGDRISQRLKPAQFSNRWARFAAPALGVVLLAWSMPRVKAEFFGELARIALRDHQFSDARDNADRALARERKNPDLCYYSGEAHHYLGLEDPDAETRFRHYSDAADAFARGLALFPQDTRLLLKMGRTLDNLGRFDEAAQCFDRAVRADPNFSRVYACYAVHHQMQGVFARARELYVRAGKLGDTEISPVGLHELEQLRDRPLRRRLVNDGLSEFITEPELPKAPEEAKPPAPGRPAAAL